MVPTDDLGILELGNLGIWRPVFLSYFCGRYGCLSLQISIWVRLLVRFVPYCLLMNLSLEAPFPRKVDIGMVA